MASSFSSELESDPDDFLSDPDPDDFLSESDPEELSAFLAAFLTGFSSLELSLSSEELAAFLATFSFLAGLTDSSDESESEDDSTLVFFCGTTAFSVFFCALLALPLEAAETFEAALDLF